ncbi:MAG TPA: cytochrome C552 [Proteobacteria bacterium]|nr:hydroxylamine oxidoreductase precursor [bacterium BMS3Abin14]HDL52984.1 cytochrome C552 [Pseudomonadota bacterium]
MKRGLFFVLLTLFVFAVPIQSRAGEKFSSETQDCLDCHSTAMPAIIMQWSKSAHWEAGVGCYECHKADKDDKDAMDHNGFTIAILVTPKDCGKCHPVESAEQQASHHAAAGDILNSADALLGQTLGGEPAVAAGCGQCHGSLVQVNDDGTLNPATWPNTGIGRVNPDGSKGSCSACHTRHRFSKAQARRPDVCGKCHLGPDHPQKEVYEESKHGILYKAFTDELNLDRPKWVAGEDYSDAPTCASCHMGAAGEEGVTHDVGKRLSWNLRSPISKKKDNWEVKREAMKEVCTACHAPDFVSGFYKQLDEFVELYNTKFAIPATEIRSILIKEGIISKGNFDDEIDWIYWELWHHEGRRARHGAAMSGPDYTWWHGLYEVAKHFYTEFLPTAKRLSEEAGKPEVYEAIQKKYIEGDPRHEWYIKGFDKKRLEKVREYYRERYKQDIE